MQNVYLYIILQRIYIYIKKSHYYVKHEIMQKITKTKQRYIFYNKWLDLDKLRHLTDEWTDRLTLVLSTNSQNMTCDLWPLTWTCNKYNISYKYMRID